MSWFGPLLKAVIAAALVGGLLASGRLNVGALSGLVFDPHAIAWGFFAVAVLSLCQLLVAWRLVLLFRSSRQELPFGRALALTLIGSLAGAVLPGILWGDAVKAVFLSRDAAGRRGHAVATILVDRALGLYALFLLATLSLAAAGCVGALPAYGPVLWAAPAITLVLTAGLVLAAWPPLYRWSVFQEVLERLPRMLRGILEGLRDCLRCPRVLIAAVGISLLNHSLIVVTLVVAAAVLRDPLSWSAQFLLGPLAMAMNAIPLTPGGIGLAEGAFSLLYQYAGSPNGATIGLLGRLFLYVTYALGGGLALLFVRVSAKPTAAQPPPPHFTIAAGGDQVPDLREADEYRARTRGVTDTPHVVSSGAAN